MCLANTLLVKADMEMNGPSRTSICSRLVHVLWDVRKGCVSGHPFSRAHRLLSRLARDLWGTKEVSGRQHR